jgi:hypothetical protein
MPGTLCQDVIGAFGKAAAAALAHARVADPRADLHSLAERTRATRAEDRTNLTEAFQQWAAENPDEVLAAQEEDAARELSKLEAEQRKVRPKGGVRKARRREVEDELKAAGVPF